MLINKQEAQASVLTPVVATNYTVRIGTGGIYDVAVKVVNPANHITITVPDGTFVGQPLIIWVDSNSGSKNVTINANGSSAAVLTTAGDYVALVWVGKDWQILGPKANLAAKDLALSGNATIDGTLGVTGDVAVNTDKLTITASSGDVTSAGTITADSIVADTSASLPDGLTVTGTLATSAGSSAGKYLTIVNGGTTYKIALLAAGS